jgi:hypothetical protein
MSPFRYGYSVARSPSPGVGEKLQSFGALNVLLGVFFRQHLIIANVIESSMPLRTAQELLHHSLATLKVMSFEPTATSNGSLICDAEVALDGYGVEECGHGGISHRALLGQGFFLPNWMRELLGFSSTSSERWIGTARDKLYPTIHCEIVLHAMEPRCVRLSTREEPLEVSVAITSQLDNWWFNAVIALIALSQFKRAFLRTRWIQIVVCLSLGIFALLVGALIYLFKDFHQTRLGKIGLVAAFGIGGCMAIFEGMVAMVFNYATAVLQDNVHAQLFLLGLGVLAAAAAQWLFGYMILRVSSMLFTLAQILLCLFIVARNRESSIVLLASLLALLVARAWATGTQLTLRVIATLLFGPLSVDPDAGPHDDFPDSVRKEIDSSPPLCSNGYVGSREQKFRRYHLDGELQTREALKALAERIRSDPQRFTSRVSNPSSLRQFAARYAEKPVGKEV